MTKMMVAIDLPMTSIMIVIQESKAKLLLVLSQESNRNRTMEYKVILALLICQQEQQSTSK